MIATQCPRLHQNLVILNLMNQQWKGKRRKCWKVVAAILRGRSYRGIHPRMLTRLRA